MQVYLTFKIKKIKNKSIYNADQRPCFSYLIFYAKLPHLRHQSMVYGSDSITKWFSEIFCYALSYKVDPRKSLTISKVPVL